MEYVTNDTVEAMTNGTEQSFVDNRPKIVVDPKQVETWELMVMESENLSLTNVMLVLARYLCRGDVPLSPGLPAAPIDELSKAEIAQIRNSDAFKYLKTMKASQIRPAVQAFVENAVAGF